MTADPAVVAAHARVVASKAQLDASVADAKAKLNPRSLASDAVETATEKANRAAQSGIQIARHRPATTAAALAAIGLLLVRKPIFAFIGSLFRKRPAHEAEPGRKTFPAGEDASR